MSPALLQATARLNKSAQDLIGHAQFVESGLGETPLQDHVQSLAQAQLTATSGGLTVALLGLSANAVAKTLSLWLGGDYFSCRTLIPARSACFELRADKGNGWTFQVGVSKSSYESLNSLAPAVEAAERAVPERVAVLDCPKIVVPAPAGCEGLRVLIPAGIDTLRKHGSLASWLGDQATLIILVGHSDDALDAAAIEALQPVVSAVGALRCISLSPTESGVPPWTHSVQSAITLPLLTLLDANPGALQGSTAEMVLLREFSRMRGLEGAAHLVLDALSSENTSTQNRKRLVDPSRLGPSVPVPSSESNPRALSDKVMKPFAYELEEIRRNRDEEAARAIGPEGPLYDAVQRLVDETTFEDLRQETLNQTIRLSLSAATLDRLRNLVRRALNRNLMEDLEIVSDAVNSGLEALNASLSERTGFTHKIHVPDVDGQRLCDSMGAQVQINIRYKGEIPRATWRTRMQGARSWMMNISMFLMLSGGFGVLLAMFGMDQRDTQTSLRNILMVGMFLAFFLGLFATVFGFKKVRAEAIEREMDKLRDAVMQELSRLFHNLMGEKRRILAEHLQRVQKEIEGEVGQIFQSLNDGARVDLERNRSAAMEKGRILDNKLRTVQQSQLNCRQTLSELAQVQIHLTQAIVESQRSAAAAAPVAKPTPAAPAFQRPAIPPAPANRPERSAPAAPTFTPPPAAPSPLDTFTPPPAVTQSFS